MKKYLIYCCNGDGGDWAPVPTKPLDSDEKMVIKIRMIQIKNNIKKFSQ